MLSLAHVKIGWLIKPAHADADIWTQVNRRRFLDKKDDFSAVSLTLGSKQRKKHNICVPRGLGIHLVNRKVSQEDRHAKRTK